MESSLKEKNLLPVGANSFLQELTPFYRTGKYEILLKDYACIICFRLLIKGILGQNVYMDLRHLKKWHYHKIKYISMAF